MNPLPQAACAAGGLWGGSTRARVGVAGGCGTGPEMGSLPGAPAGEAGAAGRFQVTGSLLSLPHISHPKKSVLYLGYGAETLLCEKNDNFSELYD